MTRRSFIGWMMAAPAAAMAAWQAQLPPIQPSTVRLIYQDGTYADWTWRNRWADEDGSGAGEVK